MLEHSDRYAVRVGPRCARRGLVAASRPSLRNDSLLVGITREEASSTRVLRGRELIGESYTGATVWRFRQARACRICMPCRHLQTEGIPENACAASGKDE